MTGEAQGNENPPLRETVRRNGRAGIKKKDRIQLWKNVF